VLVPVLVGLRLPSELVFGEMVAHTGVRVAAEGVLDADFRPSVGEHVFDAGARQRVGGERVAVLTLDHRRESDPRFLRRIEQARRRFARRARRQDRGSRVRTPERNH
jgi:hypothetical protein